MFKSLICIAFGSLLVGCANELHASRCGTNPNDIISQIDTKRLIDEMVVGLCPIPSASDLPMAKSDLIVIPDFVDVHSLQPGRIGVTLGEALRVSVFAKCKTPIRQVDLSRNFKLNSNGLVALTRNTKEVRQDSFPASTAIIGTYNIEGSKLSLVVRRVDVESATFTAVVSTEVTWSCEESFVGERKFVFKLK